MNAPLPSPRLFHRTALCALGLLIATSTWAAPQAAKKAAPTARHAKATRSAKPSVPAPVRYADAPAALALADQIAQQQGLDADWVRRQIGAAQRLPSVARLMLPAPAGTPKNWAAYRARFIEPVRLAAGQRFWLANRDTLARAEAEYGVPASLIVGVIGVETLYGQHTGNFRVIDALSTLALDFPAEHPRAATRQQFFRDELGHYLRLTHSEGLDPLALRGSYAGAMGWPQFMPSSWAQFAVDFDGNGHIDLFNSPVDVIGSVANYFKAYGWQSGQPTHYPVAFDAAKLDKDTLLAPDILPSFNVESFMAKGAVLEGPALQHTGKLALIELQNGEAPASYLAGTDNFYVVTRYNWSSYYALAVIELGQAVQGLVEGK